MFVVVRHMNHSTNSEKMTLDLALSLRRLLRLKEFQWLFRRRFVMLAAVTYFLLSLLWCGLSWSMHQLLQLRVLRLVLICWCLLPYRFRSTLCIRVECEQSEMERLGVT